MDLVEEGNELLPDLCVSWRESIDARHTETRAGSLDALGMLEQLRIVSELKVTATTARSTPFIDVLRDLRKLGAMASALVHHSSSELAVYMVILDNHRRLKNRSVTVRFSPERMEDLLGRAKSRWDEDLPVPRVLVGGEHGVDRYIDWKFVANG